MELMVHFRAMARLKMPRICRHSPVRLIKNVSSLTFSSVVLNQCNLCHNFIGALLTCQKIYFHWGGEAQLLPLGFICRLETEATLVVCVIQGMTSAIGRSAIGNILWGYPTSFPTSQRTLFFASRIKARDVEQNIPKSARLCTTSSLPLKSI